MRHYVALIAVAFFSGLAVTGCATITVGRHQEVQVVTSPPGAKASTEGISITTPGTFTLRRDANHVILIEKDGYLPETVTLTSGIGMAVAGNIVFGGLIGWGIDAASGAQYKLYPETVNIGLRTVAAPPPLAAPQATSGQASDDRPSRAEAEKNVTADDPNAAP